MDKKTARRVIKASVWQNLQGNWLKAFSVIVIQFLIISAVISFLPIRIPTSKELLTTIEAGLPVLVLFFPKGITPRILSLIAVTAALYILISCPLKIGINRFFISVARGEKAKISYIFTPFANLKTVLGSIWLNVLIFLISTFWAVIFALIPIALMFIATYFGSYAIADVAIMATYAMAIFTMLWISRYSFALYIFAESDERTPFESLRECLSLVNYRTSECITLRASYLAWDLISSATPLIFVYQPLFNTVYAKYVYYFRGELSIGESEFPPEM